MAIDLGGYDFTFLEEPPDSLKCLICLGVVKRPQQHGECGKLFCLECISEHRKRSKHCPYCRRSLTVFNDGKSSQEVNALKVKCDNLGNGCQWEGELCSLKFHLQKCNYILVLCPNKCETNQETLKLLRHHLDNHLTNECPRRRHSCPHCREVGEYAERTTIHLDSCSKLRVKCPNDGCGVEVYRCELSNHCSVCEYERTPCKFAKFGCDLETIRRHIKAHEENGQLHLQCTKEKVLQLTEQLKDQEEKITSLETTKELLSEKVKQQGKKIIKLQNNILAPPKFTFKFRQFNHHKAADLSFESPSFYSNKDGYKLFISVDASGYPDSSDDSSDSDDDSDDNDDTYVAVYVHLQRGENDGSLMWPFTGKVTIELLNQLQDKTHTRYIITYEQAEQAGRRVWGASKGMGWGKPKFISHKDLGLNRRKKCQYLKDDTLVFRVSVEIPDYKPWLESFV